MADIRISLENNTQTLAMDMGSTQTLNMTLSGGGGYAPIRNYEALTNKPLINGVTLIGNKLLADLFPDGIIIDGGTAEGAS